VIGGVNRLGGLVLDDCDLQDAGMQELFAALTALTPDLQLTSLRFVRPLHPAQHPL
jgi:hypothetical protein